MAFGVARDRNPLADAVARLRTVARGTAVPVVVHAYDRDAIDAVVAEVTARFAREPVSASVNAGASDFSVSPSSVGARLDASQLRSLLAAAVNTADPADVSIQLSTTPVPALVSTADAQAVAAQAAAMVAEPLGLLVGEDDDPLQLSTKQLRSILTFGKPAGSGYLVQVDPVATGALLDKLAGKVSREPRDASFIFGTGGITGVKPGVEGRALNISGSIDAVRSALGARADGTATPDAKLAFSVTPAPLSTDAAKAALPKMRRISSWTTYYVPAISNYWGANISIPARDLNGYVLAPGERFSFWDGIGPVTTSRGYGYGGVIINGRSYPTGALAGGICSTSTTLFNAAMRAGLEIGERTNHSYYIERYPVGLDAIVLKTDTSVTDMTFRNDTEQPILIRSYTGSGFVRFDLWGVADGRTVSLSKAATSNHVAARDTVVVNRNMKPGTSKRVESPHDGFHAVVSRTVRDKDGEVLHHDVWESFYRVVNGVTEVGPTPKPAPPPPPSPSASPSPSPSPSPSA
jgi:vancomycin resistance protein YoaR